MHWKNKKRKRIKPSRLPNPVLVLPERTFSGPHPDDNVEEEDPERQEARNHSAKMLLMMANGVLCKQQVRVLFLVSYSHMMRDGFLLQSKHLPFPFQIQSAQL